MKYMIFYREEDGQHFLFNGSWPINVSPDCSPAWGNQTGDVPYHQQIQTTEEDLPKLRSALKGTTLSFTLRKKKYVVLTRGEFHQKQIS